MTPFFRNAVLPLLTSLFIVSLAVCITIIHLTLFRNAQEKIEETPYTLRKN